LTLRIGIVGTGWFADMHAKLLSQQEDVKVVAATATSQQKADAFVQKLDGAKGYASVHNMLDDQQLVGVYICTPPFIHGEIEEALIERSIPFLVEKPISHVAELPEQLLLKVQEKQLITSVGYHFRYMDGADQAKQLLSDRAIGMSLGYWMGDAPGGTWWRRQERSGGQFVEQTTHIVDLLRYLAGEVTEVYAAYGNGILSKQDENANVADVGTVTLKLANGSVATISNTCILPAGSHSGLNIYTDAGKLEIGHSGIKDITAHTTTEYHNINNPYLKEAQAFLHAIRTGDTSQIRSNYEDAVKTHRITTAANTSAITGQVIKL